MKNVLLFRLAGVLTVVQYAVHAVLFMTYKPSHGQAEINFVNEMKTQVWSFGGHPRSYWDFYFGYALLTILSGLIEALLLFYAAKIGKQFPELAKRLALILFIAVLCHLLLVQHYFFFTPAIFDLVILGILATALKMRTVVPATGNVQSATVH